jgi:trk system potassium uptake protein TrkA
VPKYGLVHLLDLPEERLEIIELVIGEEAAVAGRQISEIEMPDGSLIVAVIRAEGGGFVPTAETIIKAGDEVLVVLDPGLEDAITAQFVGADVAT